MIPEVAALGPGNIAASAAHHQYATDRWATGQGFVDVLFQWDAFTATHAFIGGDHGAAVGIENTVSQGIGGETAKHHRVDGADAGAGEHGERGPGIIGM